MADIFQIVMFSLIVVIIAVLLQSVIQWIVGTSKIIKQQDEIIELLKKQINN